MAPYKETPPVEVVTWFDHSGSIGVERFTLVQIAGRLKDDVVMRTVGFLVYEDERLLTLAHEARIDADFGEAEFGQYTTIYKALIMDRTPLLCRPRGVDAARMVR